MKKREEDEGGEMREREFGTFTLLFLNVNIHFRTVYVSLSLLSLDVVMMCKGGSVCVRVWRTSALEREREEERENKRKKQREREEKGERGSAFTFYLHFLLFRARYASLHI